MFCSYVWRLGKIRKEMAAGGESKEIRCCLRLESDCIEKICEVAIQLKLEGAFLSRYLCIGTKWRKPSRGLIISPQPPMSQ